MPSWPDAPFDHPLIFGEQYKSWSFSLCCFIHPALILSLLVPDIFLSLWILNTLVLCSSIIVRDQVWHQHDNRQNCNSVVTFCSWSVRQYSCQYMTKFVNLLCQCVTVRVCSFGQLYIYVVTAAAGAEADRCMWAHCASEVLWEARSYNVQESLQQVAALWPQVHRCLFCCVHTEVSGVGSLCSATCMWTLGWCTLLHAEPKWVLQIYMCRLFLCLILSSIHIQ